MNIVKYYYISSAKRLLMPNPLIQEPLSLRKAGLHFRAVNHRLRQQILQLLHHNARLTVTSIQNKLRLEQSVASQHLAILRKADLVHTERDGKWIFYTVNYQRLKLLHDVALMLNEQKANKELQ
jgi:DNA-binding transcriptional ArsR family regulator